MDLGYENVTQSVGLLSSPNHTNIVARPLTCFFNGSLSLEVAAGNFSSRYGCDDLISKGLQRTFPPILLQLILGATQGQSEQVQSGTPLVRLTIQPSQSG